MPDGTDTTPPDSDGNVQVPPRETLEPDAHGGVPEGGRSFFGAIEDQLAIRRVIHQYMIPAGTNTLWYTLGGVLAISLVLEIITGVILALRYVPDAERAYGTTSNATPRAGMVGGAQLPLLEQLRDLRPRHDPHVRVFISGAYRRGKHSCGVLLRGRRPSIVSAEFGYCASGGRAVRAAN